VLRKFIALLVFALCPLVFAQQALNNAAVIKLVKAGLSDDIIVSTINASPGSYDVSVDGLISLKTSGASEKVISAILRKASDTKSSAAATASTEPDSNAAPATSPNPGPQETTGASAPSKAPGPEGIQPGARVVIAPMGGFETYFAAAVREKKVPIVLTVDKASAEFFIVSANTEWQGFVFGSGGAATWNNSGGSAAYGAAASSTRGLEASIMLISAKTKDVVWAYEVHKSSHGALLFGTLAAPGQQSLAEACAKHLKEYIEKGK